MVLCDMMFWVISNGQQFIVNDTVSTEAEDLELKRVSSTHRDARAFDLSIHGWSLEFNIKFKEHFSEKYMDLAAVGKDGVKRLIVEHDAGTGVHIHVQLNSQYKGGFES